MMLRYCVCRYERRNIYEEARSGRVSVNIWGYMTLHGVGDILQINGRFTADKYVDILQNFFLPSLQNNNIPFPPGPINFVHDRCPVHVARAVQQWFGHQNNLEVLPWPSKGCDMNPIENLWGSLVNTWEPEWERTQEQLMDHTRAQWELFRGNPNLVRGYGASMPDRLQDVIEKEGGWTRH